MTDDKLNAFHASDGAGQLTFCSIDDDAAPLRALDEAIRAKLVHVAIGVGGSGSQVVRMLVDLSVHVSLQEAHIRAQGSFTRGIIVLHGATSHGRRYDSDAHVWDRANILAPKWSHVATQTHMSNVMHTDLVPATVEPLTLRLLFDAQSHCGASRMAELLCARFSAWHAATTSLKEAMTAIRGALIVPDSHPTAQDERMIYRSGSVCKGWRDKIVDPAHFLRSSFEDDAGHGPRLAAPVAELCKQRVEAAWHETAKALQHAGPATDEASGTDEADINAAADAADDFVCAGRMTSLWYGSKRRRLRKR
jgi:hypothetical protein